MTMDVRTADADAFAVVVGRPLSWPGVADASASFSYFTCPQVDADATLRVTAFADGRTLTHPSKGAFSLPLTAIERVQKRGTISKI